MENKINKIQQLFIAITIIIICFSPLLSLLSPWFGAHWSSAASGGDRLPEAHALLGECRYRAARDANSSSALGGVRPQ